MADTAMNPPQIISFFIGICAVIGRHTVSSSHVTGWNVSATKAVRDHVTDTVNCSAGSAALLPCSVASVRHRPVWIRRRDYHILTEGETKYIRDPRFVPLFSRHNHTWSLKIQPARLTDSGIYECQVAGGSLFISSFVKLNVYKALARIYVSAEISANTVPSYLVERGTAIRLYCVIIKSPIAPVYVFWYYNGMMINFDTTQQRLSITFSANKVQKSAISTLVIKDARQLDSGNYTCQPSNAAAVSIYVYVSKGDNLAAVHRIESSSSRSSEIPKMAITLPSILFFIHKLYNV